MPRRSKQLFLRLVLSLRSPCYTTTRWWLLLLGWSVSFWFWNLSINRFTEEGPNLLIEHQTSTTGLEWRLGGGQRAVREPDGFSFHNEQTGTSWVSKRVSVPGDARVLMARGIISVDRFQPGSHTWSGFLLGLVPERQPGVRINHSMSQNEIIETSVSRWKGQAILFLPREARWCRLITGLFQGKGTAFVKGLSVRAARLSSPFQLGRALFGASLSILLLLGAALTPHRYHLNRQAIKVGLMIGILVVAVMLPGQVIKTLADKYDLGDHSPVSGNVALSNAKQIPEVAETSLTDIGTKVIKFARVHPAELIHFGLFFILSFIVLWPGRPKHRWSTTAKLAIVATASETIQLMTIHRTAQIFDLLVDALGILCAVFATFVLSKLNIRRFSSLGK